ESDAGKPGSVQSTLFHRGRLGAVICLLFLALPLAMPSWLAAQTVTSTLQGRISDATGAVIPEASVTALNTATGLKRTVNANAVGEYQIGGLPAGDYTVNAEKQGFQKSAKKIHLDLGASGTVDFALAPGQVQTQVEVQDVGEVAEPTRTMVSSVIDQQKNREPSGERTGVHRFRIARARHHHRKHDLRQHRRHRRTGHQALLRRSEHSLQFHRSGRRR